MRLRGNMDSLHNVATFDALEVGASLHFCSLVARHAYVLRLKLFIFINTLKFPNTVH